MGQTFVGGGAGFTYVFPPGVALQFDLNYMRLFPTTGNALSPELGVAFGF
jgi:hypothetical protein